MIGQVGSPVATHCPYRSLQWGLPFPLSDIAQTQAILLVGSDPAETMPPAMQHFGASRAAGNLAATPPPVHPDAG
jgi:assimilatory nitrate reductase catalytic subunit